jgi:aminoglycoside/choline kinase family phosphotransferase
MPEAAAPPGLAEPLCRWLAAHGFPRPSLSPLVGDVSARRYYQARSPAGATAVLAVYPRGDGESCRRFSLTTRLLAGAAVPVPAVLAADCESGWMLLEDLGPLTLYDLRREPWEVVEPYLEVAVSLAGRIASLPPAEVTRLSPPLDRDLLRRELQQTWEAFLAPRGLVADPPLAARLRSGFDALCAALGRAPQVPCHRDFMARNLVPTRGPDLPLRPAAAAGAAPIAALAVLDHQDLRLGPACYDLASLLNDSLFPPPAVEERLLALALAPGTDRTAYHRAAAQRTLKAVGTFSAFASRGNQRHLPLVRPTLGRALVHLRRLPETARLAGDLEREWAGCFC